MRKLNSVAGFISLFIIITALCFQGYSKAIQANNEPFSTVATSTTEDTIGLNAQKSYTFYHRGTNASLSADTGNILMMVGAGTNDGGVGLNKAVLVSGTAIVVGPGVSMVRVKSGSGTPCITIYTSSN